MRAAESSRYVALKPARQSSAGGVTYGIYGLRHWIAARLYVLRIASAVALAKTAHGAGTEARDVGKGRKQGVYK
ncbi:MAG: hypothetical protein LBM98_09580 [Oscillospiraceae bacterium]|nr:hypothetical protein [Oscillospiraceae bacterium]